MGGTWNLPEAASPRLEEQPLISVLLERPQLGAPSPCHTQRSHREAYVQAGLCRGRGLRSSGGHGTKLGTTLLLRRVQLKSRGKWGQDSNFGSQNI